MPADFSTAYFDANVILAFVSEEEHRAIVVRELLRQGDQGHRRIYTSTMSIAEVAFGAQEKVTRALDHETETRIDADARFAINWFEQYGFDEAGYDPAEGLARAMNVSVKGLEDAGILVARASRVRLLRRVELAADWGPATDTRMPVWEVTQQLVRALWDEGSEAKAGDLGRRLGGIGEVARDLAYRLYAICERRGWAEDALGFNALVTSWPEIALRAGSLAPIQPELT